MTTDKKLYIALGVLAVLGGAAYFQQQKKQKDTAAHSLEAAADKLPEIALGDEEIKKIDKVELVKPPEGDGGSATTVVLKKKGDEDWELVEPTTAKANASNVKSLVDNLKRLEVREEIDPGTESYEKFKLTDGAALHATFYKGDEKAADLYFGEDGSRGQMTRIAGKDGVYAVKGYSSFLYQRDVAGWRDKTIFKFDDKDAVKVTIDNENGVFSFEKDGDEWKAEHAKSDKAPAKKLEGFDKGKLESMLRAYKSLNANDFADDKKPGDVGLDEPTATVTISLKDGSQYQLTVGDTAEGSSRWVKKKGSDQIFSVSSWSAEWATADTKKFEKGEDEDETAPKPGAMPTGMPTGMPMGGGVKPAGHP